jgi:hypothetical protein
MLKEKSLLWIHEQRFCSGEVKHGGVEQVRVADQSTKLCWYHTAGLRR